MNFSNSLMSGIGISLGGIEIATDYLFNNPDFYEPDLTEVKSTISNKDVATLTKAIKPIRPKVTKDSIISKFSIIPYKINIVKDEIIESLPIITNTIEEDFDCTFEDEEESIIDDESIMEANNLLKKLENQYNINTENLDNSLEKLDELDIEDEIDIEDTDELDIEDEIDIEDTDELDIDLEEDELDIEDDEINIEDKLDIDLEDDEIDIEDDEIDIEDDDINIEDDEIDLENDEIDIDNDGIDIEDDDIDLEEDESIENNNELDIKDNISIKNNKIKFDDETSIEDDDIDIEDDDIDLEEDEIDISEQSNSVSIQNTKRLNSSEVDSHTKNSNHQDVIKQQPINKIDDYKDKEIEHLNKRLLDMEKQMEAMRNSVNAPNSTSNIKNNKNKIDEIDNVINKANKVDTPNYEQYSNMSIDSLYKEVKVYMNSLGLQKRAVDLTVLNNKFGDVNIRKLIQKSYLIKFGKGVTTGR